MDFCTQKGITRKSLLQPNSTQNQLPSPTTPQKQSLTFTPPENQSRDTHELIPLFYGND